MNKLILLGLTVLVSACTTTAVPIKPKFPAAPKELLQSCEPLKPLNPKPQLSEVAKTIVENYSLHHQCANRVLAWHDWYQLQKSIFEQEK